LRVIWRPLGREVRGCQWRSVSAREGSIVTRWTSPVRGGANRGSKEPPSRSASSLTRWRTSVSIPVPTLRAPLAVESAGGEHRRDHVSYEDVIARLAAVAVDGRRSSGAEQAAEDRDHAGLPERVLTGAVDVPSRRQTEEIP
jgi:hypothetical protein